MQQIVRATRRLMTRRIDVARVGQIQRVVRAEIERLMESFSVPDRSG